VTDPGRFELSLKALEPPPEDRPRDGATRGRARVTGDLDEKLSDFMKRSQQRISQVRRREGRRRGGR